MSIVVVKLIPLDQLTLEKGEKPDVIDSRVMEMRTHLEEAMRQFDRLVVEAEKRKVFDAWIADPRKMLGVRIPTGPANGWGEYRWLLGWLQAFNTEFCKLHGALNGGAKGLFND